jgi:hypothetical protein
LGDTLYRVGGSHVRATKADAKKLSDELKAAGDDHDIVTEHVPEPQSLFIVRSALTGAEVCGPYEREEEAKRERDRLNMEATFGRTAPSEHHPNGQELGTRLDDSLPIHAGLVDQAVSGVVHKGEPMSYEISTREGVILAGG